MMGRSHDLINATFMESKAQKIMPPARGWLSDLIRLRGYFR